MKRFKNILLIADGRADANVFKRASSLAECNRASLCVIDVVRPAPDSLPVAGVRAADLQARVVAERRDALRQLAGDSAIVEVRVGTPFIEIVRKVLRDGHDLVIKAPEGKGGNGLLFGSTDMHLLRKCPCPVWIIKPSRRKHFGPILAAVDLDMPDATAQALNTAIVQLALSLARSEDSELHLVYAWSLFGESVLRGLRVDIDLHKALSQTRDHYKKELDALIHRHDLQGVVLHPHLIKGEPEKVIPALVSREQVELIVMGTVARTGISGFLIGNTAEKVLGQVNCSVMALKPEGFRTPVRLHD